MSKKTTVVHIEEDQHEEVKRIAKKYKISGQKVANMMIRFGSSIVEEKLEKIEQIKAG